MKKRTKLIAGAVLALALIAGLTALRSYLQAADEQAEATSSRQYADPAPEDHPALVWYRGQYPDKELLLACAADVTNSGQDDLVVIYRAGKGAAEAVALIAGEDGGYTLTPAIPAPREHQKMRFFNMDDGPELEFLITGDKNGEVGYAVYQIMDGAIVNLFGEGMEDCC